MTTTRQLAASPADYQTTIRVNASPDALFEALTTVTGLAAWWNPATGLGETGGELRFIMNAPEPLVIHVDEATRPTLVRWTVTECPFLPDWIGTGPTFTITAVDGDTSELNFRHHGLSEELECIDMCTRSWNHYMMSLRDYLEVGRGSPFGSAADRARREAQARGKELSEVTVSSVKSFTRVVSTADGDSAFEDAELQLSEQQVAEGVPAMFAGALGPAPGVAFVRFAAFHSQPHPASEPQWVIVLRGTIEVQVSDGSSRQFGPGDLVLAADTGGRGHITRVVGNGPVEALSIVSVRAG